MTKTKTTTHTANRAPYCHETYADALTWSAEQRRRQCRGCAEQLGALSPLDDLNCFQVIVQEMRAVRYAEHDVARQMREEISSAEEI
jgi:transcriptional regulator NrdR family protein